MDTGAADAAVSLARTVGLAAALTVTLRLRVPRGAATRGHEGGRPWTRPTTTSRDRG
jgi:hypothetical protein